MLKSYSTQIIAITLIAILLLPLSFPRIPFASAEDMSANKLFDLAAPGVVMILTIVNTTISFPIPSFDQNKLTSYIEGQVNAGVLDANDKQALVNAAILELQNNPLQYLVPTSDIRQKGIQTYWIGTGFIISSDGYIVTNAHVAAPSDSTIRTQLAVQTFANLTDTIKQSV